MKAIFAPKDDKGDCLPAVGSIGEIVVNGNELLFFPDDEEQLPCPKDEFGGYCISENELIFE